MRRRSFILGGAALTTIGLTTRITSAQTALPGIDEATKTVTIGAFTPITGPVPFYTLLTHGADACFRWAEKTNQLDGWKIKYITYDDGYDPARSVAVTKRLVEEDNIFALVTPVGTPTTVATVPYAKSVGLPIIGPLGGSPEFYSEPLVFTLFPDYGWSAGASAQYALDKLGAKRIGFLWENDEVGRSAKRGFDAYMASKSLEPAASLSFEVKSTDFAPQIRQLIREKADVVIMFGANSNLALALKSAKLLNFSAHWIAPFFNADPSTRKLAGNALNGVQFSSWLLPVTSDNERIKIYREASKEYYPKDPFGIFGLNGWTNAELFVVGMRILLKSGNSLTRENFIQAMNSIRDVDIGGTEKVTFKLGDHRGTRQECIIEAMPSGEFEMVRGFEPYPKVVFDQKLI